MRRIVRACNPVHGLLPTDVDAFASLAELALDMRWSWNHDTDLLWRELDPALWKITRNPWVVLQTVSRHRLMQVSADPAFRNKVDALLRSSREMAAAPTWFEQNYPQAPLTGVAYFSMEFMLSEALPIYSGGLGNVAGDQLKAASDLGVPVIGVGLLYQQGYFRQVIDKRGAQQALYPYNDPGQLPIRPVRGPNDEWLRLKIELPDYSIWFRAWEAQVGRVKLYLLDSNDAANIPAMRSVAGQLYGGGSELRLQQELLLGIGGWRLLAELGVTPEVCHLNEGHAAFAVLERARGFMQETRQPFDVALAVTRAGNLFTTHTAVSAGFDLFDPALIAQYLKGYAERELGLPLPVLLGLGRKNPNDAEENFNMAYLAIRGSGAVNGVSRLHGRVSRQLFAPLFPRWPQDDVPVEYVTNGVHTPTWDSAAADALWTGTCGQNRWLGTTESLSQAIRGVADTELWKFRNTGRESLVEYARQRLSQQLAAAGASSATLEEAGHFLDPDTLTVVFARRFATYKRPTLLLHDPARLLRLLMNPERPVQLILAGKAHPADKAGQELILQWMHFIWQSEARSQVIFLSDYDMRLTEHLVQGADVWLNTPRRPWEASGTSGMKILANGGVNLSELDGWWAEGHSPTVGWALGDGQEHGDDPAWDAVDAEALYTLLENEVVPEFYSRDAQGVPTAWVARMRESMATLTPHFSTNRVVRDYTNKHYVPAATNYRARAADKGEQGVRMIGWQRVLEQKWAELRFDKVSIATLATGHVFQVQVYLDAVEPDAVRVELYAEGLGGGDPVRQEMERVRPLPGATNRYLYRAQVPASRPASHYTPRIVARRIGVSVPLEAAFILWQR
ncbi:MAG: alpha-glucan family phosphorylase [Steroidobacteraceae bacterium]